MIKVTVIIPVYGVERFVGRCVESVLQQSYSALEVIIVDDCSPDRSMEIVRDVIDRFPWRDVKILHHKENRGLPAARNTGLAAASGEYVYHVDGDDFIEPDMISAMVEATEGGRFDIVYSDWLLSYENSERYMPQPSTTSPTQMLEAILTGKMKFNVWNKLVRRSLYTDKNIYFPEGYGMGEDMTMIKVVAVSGSVKYLPKAFYHYVKVNSGAMTENVSSRRLDQIKHNVDSVVDFLGHINVPERLLALFKLSVKLPLLFSDSKANYYSWNEMFAEADRYSCDSSLPIRTRVIQWIAKRRIYPALRLHYLIYDKLYAFLYKS